MNVVSTSQTMVMPILGVLFVAAGCQYVPHSDTQWTPTKAKEAILKPERAYAERLNVDAPLECTDEYFDHVVSVDPSMSSRYWPERAEWTAVTPHATISGSCIVDYKGINRVYFRDIDTVRSRWNPYSLVVSPLSCGLIGPLGYHRYIVLKPGIDVPGALSRKSIRCARNNEIPVVSGGDDWAWSNIFPLWIIGVRPFLHSDKQAEAILYMVNRARFP